MAGRSRPALFLDRDGTIIEDRHYLGDPAGVVLLAGAAAGISRFNRAGWPVIVVTNQSGIGRGIIGADQYEAVNDRMIDLLGVESAEVTAIYHCPHDPLGGDPLLVVIGRFEHCGVLDQVHADQQ